MNQNYVGFGRRFVAILVDGVILYIINVLLVFLLKTALDDLGTMISSVLGLVINLGYFVVYQAQVGQTLGKKALGIKVVNDQGQKPSVITFFLREIVGKFISSLILMIGYLMVLWDGKKQALHDKIANTYVVRV